MAVNLEDKDIRVEVLEVIKAAKEAVSLTDAKIICSGGRGLGGPEGFELIEALSPIRGGRSGRSLESGSRRRLDRPEPSGGTDRNHRKA